MGKPNKINTMEEGASTEQRMEKRLEELEIKIAFMEKEVEEYKEASRGFYRKLSEAEEEIRKLWKEVPERNLPVPEVTWDSETRDSLP